MARCKGLLRRAAETPAHGRRARGGRHFARVDAEGFELWFDPGALDPPEELHLGVRGRRTKRVEAYWNGCVYAV